MLKRILIRKKYNDFFQENVSKQFIVSKDQNTVVIPLDDDIKEHERERLAVSYNLLYRSYKAPTLAKLGEKYIERSLHELGSTLSAEDFLKILNEPSHSLNMIHYRFSQYSVHDSFREAPQWDYVSKIDDIQFDTLRLYAAYVAIEGYQLDKKAEVLKF